MHNFSCLDRHEHAPNVNEFSFLMYTYSCIRALFSLMTVVSFLNLTFGECRCSLILFFYSDSFASSSATKI